MANFEHAEVDPKHVKMSGETPAASASEPPVGGASAPDAQAAEAPCVVPSFAAASELLSAPYSCLVMNTHRRHVALPPMYLHKKRTGIQEELEGELLKFSQSLKGVPLAYQNIRITRQHGDIYDDSGYIHMDIEANFIVFQPQKGQKLLGKVNKLSASHVGCLVHGCFNASVPKPNLVPVETWRDAGPRIGAQLEFDVTALDADTAGVLLIRGRLDRTRVQELLAIGESGESGVPTEEPEEEAPAQAPTDQLPEDSPKKKEKKKKDKVKEEDAQEAVTPARQNGGGDEDEADTNGNAAPQKKKKKKKEKRLKRDSEELKAETEEVEISAAEMQLGSDSSGYHSDKPSKKRKREADGGGGGEAAPDAADTPKSKKKKKSEVA